MRENSKTILFAIILCVTCSLLLSGTAAVLKDLQNSNMEFDVKRNIVKAFGIDISSMERPDIEAMYTQYIQESVIDAVSGNVIEGIKPSDIDNGAVKKNLDKLKEMSIVELLQELKDNGGELQTPLYFWTDEGQDKPSKYAFPISGKGLWSMLYGYLSLDSDLETIAGISFYKHGETPGLGAEIEKAWFQSQFAGKKLYAEGKPTDFLITKPGYASGDTAVDGISGATITGKGVQKLVQKDAAVYATYFNSIKGN